MTRSDVSSRVDREPWIAEATTESSTRQCRGCRRVVDSVTSCNSVCLHSLASYLKVRRDILLPAVCTPLALIKRRYPELFAHCRTAHEKKRAIQSSVEGLPEYALQGSLLTVVKRCDLRNDVIKVCLSTRMKLLHSESEQYKNIT